MDLEIKIILGVVVAAVLGVGFIVITDISRPRFGEACAVEGERTCEPGKWGVLKCRRWPELGESLAWASDVSCDPGVCVELGDSRAAGGEPIKVVGCRPR